MTWNLGPHRPLICDDSLVSAFKELRLQLCITTLDFSASKFLMYNIDFVPIHPHRKFRTQNS